MAECCLRQHANAQLSRCWRWMRKWRHDLPEDERPWLAAWLACAQYEARQERNPPDERRAWAELAEELGTLA